MENGGFITESLNTSPGSPTPDVSGSNRTFSPIPGSRYNHLYLELERLCIDTGTNLHTSMANPMATQMLRNPVEPFSGKSTQNAARWLRKFQKERGYNPDGTPLSPAEWLEEFDILMSDVAATWCDKTPKVKKLFTDDGLASATQAQVDELKRLFLARFKPEDEDEPSNPIPDIQMLKQEKEESLEKYYHRALDLLVAAGGSDRSEGVELEMSAISLLDLTIDRFVAGLEDPTLRLRMLRHVGESTTRSLRSAYLQAGKEIKYLKAEKEQLSEMKKDAELAILRRLKDGFLSANTSNPYIPQNVQQLLHQLRDVTKDEPTQFEKYQVPTITEAPYQSREALPGSRPLREIGVPNTINDQERVTEVTERTIVKPRTTTNVPRRYQQNAANVDFDPAKSLNPYVNGSKKFRYTPGNPLCFRCGTPGHRSDACTGVQLSPPEQEVCRSIVFPNGPRNNWTQPMAANTTATPSFEHESEDSDQFEDVGYTPMASSFEVLRCLADEETDTVDVYAEKRKRVDIEDVLNPEPETTTGRKKAVAKGKGVSKKKKPLAPIQGMIGEPPVDIKEILMRTEVVMPLLHQLQLSPAFRDEMKRLAMGTRKPRKPKAKVTVEEPGTQPMVGATSAHESALKDVEQMKGSRDRAFGVPAIVWKDHRSTRIDVDRNLVMADQGSDVNLIYPDLVKTLGLKLLPIKLLNIKKMRMGLANGSHHDLTHWVKFHVAVGPVHRQVWSFVCPQESKGLSLLLGLPWLNSVNARIHVRDKEIFIGDHAKGEETVKMTVPLMQSRRAKPEPVVAPSADPDDNLSDSGESDTSSTESESESESDSEMEVDTKQYPGDF